MSQPVSNPPPDTPRVSRSIGHDDERVVTMALTLREADELWELLGDRPHREDWSNTLWRRLEMAIDVAQKGRL